MLSIHVSHRGRRHIQLAIKFFSGRANYVAEQDCEKLRRVIRCILDSIDELLFLGAIDIDILINLIDTPHRVHHDLKNHTGAANTFDWGVFLSMSSKKKINANSSACSELVGVEDHKPKVSYFLRFLHA